MTTWIQGADPLKDEQMSGKNGAEICLKNRPKTGFRIQKTQ